MRYLFLLFIILIWLASCQQTFVPKPKGYPRIDLPPHHYTKSAIDLPYSFEHSSFAKLQTHSSSISEKYWIDIIYPEHRAVVQLTYKAISSKKFQTEKQKFLNELVNDSYKLTSKHQIKAYAIDEAYVKTPLGNAATVFELEGEVPSQFQFYMTDTVKHFVRGALYFRTSTKNDSLKPVIDYIKVDMMHLINTLEWR